MRYIFLLISCTTSIYSYAQKDSLKTWEIATAFSYGSENNVGNPGFMLTNEVEYKFHPKISGSAKIGFFHSMPWFVEDSFLSYSCLLAGLHLNHTARFNENKNFVKVSVGLDYVHAYEVIAQDLDPQFPRYNRATVSTISKLGYGISLEGGGSLSEKIALGLGIQIYSFQIFGDIIVIGPNVHFTL